MNRYSPSSLVASQPHWHYQDFEQRAWQIAAELQQRQIQSISVWFEDSAKLACALLAAWQAKVRVLFLPNSTPATVQWANAYSELWLTDMQIDQSLAEQFDNFGLQQALEKRCKNTPLFDPNNQTEIWLKTSGSTGESKTIVKTAQQMWIGAEALAQALPFAAENKISTITTVSSQHIYGLTVHIMMSLVNGWQIGRKQQFYPECILAELHHAEQAVIISSPAMLSHLDWQQANLPPNIAGVISSGGALAEEVSQQMREALQKPVIEIYGSTETGPIAIRDNIQLWQTLPNSRLGTDEHAALWIEATWLANREQTADLVEFSDNGFRLLGRMDRIVKIGDKRTSLAQIENCLLKHQWVTDCYIAKHPEQTRLAAWVELNLQGIEILRENGRRFLIEQLRRELIRTQERSSIPRFWRFTDKLPRNSQSKINKLEFNQICLESPRNPIWLQQQQIENAFDAIGKVPLDLLYLKGHFDNFPLVAGVVELQWIQQKISEWLNQEVHFARLDRLKFQKFLRPNDIFELTLQANTNKDKITFQLKVEQEVCCSGVAVLES